VLAAVLVISAIVLLAAFLAVVGGIAWGVVAFFSWVTP
jgi:uncharacterized membrane protein YuzA (DUF378 family)